jgi:uncharacterized protein involved in response to NO
MAGTLLKIGEPASSPPPAPQWRAFLELGFRPLYAGGCAWAAIAVALWVFAPQWLTGPLSGVAWHAHEMLWGFVATIAVGFLLTAGATWTGVNPLKGPALGFLALAWLVARIGFLLPWTSAFIVATIGEAAFFGVAAAALGRAIFTTRNHRNAGVPLLLLALGVFDVLYLAASAGGDYARLMRHFEAGIVAMAVVALLVARRVIPFFAMRAVHGLSIPMATRSGQVAVAAGVLALAFAALDAPVALGVALAIAGAIALGQVVAWRPWRVRNVPLLWILYAGYALLGTGLIVAAVRVSGIVDLRAAWPVHVIGVGGFGVLIIGMVTRTALGHLGRPLRTDRRMVATFVLVIAAAALRIGALLPSALQVPLLHASACAWVAAFALYVWRFVPMLIRPRMAAPAPAPSGAARGASIRIGA